MVTTWELHPPVVETATTVVCCGWQEEHDAIWQTAVILARDMLGLESWQGGLVSHVDVPLDAPLEATHFPAQMLCALRQISAGRWRVCRVVTVPFDTSRLSAVGLGWNQRALKRASHLALAIDLGALQRAAGAMMHPVAVGEVRRIPASRGSV